MSGKHAAPISFEHRLDAADYAIRVRKDSSQALLIHVVIERAWMQGGLPSHFSCGCQLVAVHDEPVAQLAQRITDCACRLAPKLQDYVRQDAFQVALRYWLSFHINC
jgi:hypothetical protein